MHPTRRYALVHGLGTRATYDLLASRGDPHALGGPSLARPGPALSRPPSHLWIAALALLALSLGLAVRALFLPGADQTGPPVEGVLNARQTFDDEDLEEGLLIDLATETSANRRALARKDLLLARALILLVLAIALELTGVQ